jgi:glyoxalase family protein
MITDITGLHHVTSIASGAQANNAFFTGPLGLRRVKKTVNFDAPNVYHLYYGDAAGSPGSVMTYFPFPGATRGRPGGGEVGETVFAVPEGSLGWWQERLAGAGVAGLAEGARFGARRLAFQGPDGDGFALVEAPGDARPGWTGNGVPGDAAIHGFHSATLRLRDGGATAELLRFMGYVEQAQEGAVTRFVREGGNGAHVVDLEVLPGARPADQGAGSVHHIAFAVPDRAAQDRVRKALADTGHMVTPPIDRDYFWAIYFRTPGGVLFEVATDEPGFARDEAPERLGQGLMLPKQHAHLREVLEAKYLEPITD